MSNRFRKRWMNNLEESKCILCDQWAHDGQTKYINFSNDFVCTPCVNKGEFKESKLEDLELSEYEIFVVEAALKSVQNRISMDLFWLETQGSSVFEKCDKDKLTALMDKIEALATKLRYDIRTEQSDLAMVL